MPLSSQANTLINLSQLQARLLKQQDQWLAAHGISYREFLIMHHIQESPTHNLKRIDLAEKVGLSASGVTRLLNPMEKIGLISKEEGARDARVSLVRLTTAGTTLFQDAENSFNQRTKAFMAQLDPGQSAALELLAQSRFA